MAVFIPNDPTTLLARDRCAAALTEAGYPTSPATLATKASRGGGPPFRKYGPRVLYEWSSSLAWARSRLGPVVNSTSELDLLRTQSSHAQGDDAPAETTPGEDSSIDRLTGNSGPVPSRLAPRLP
jgi:hypothetical protein